MAAGDSASEMARRQREKAARLQRSAEHWEKGAQGEAAVAAALMDLENDGWTVLHDVRWPGRRYANIDHVVFGNGQAFILDAKNWSGDVAAGGGVLRQNGRSRAKEVAAAAEAAQAVAGLVPELPSESFHPVMCLIRDDWFSEKFGEVLVCSSQNIVTMLRGQPRSQRPLAESDIQRVILAMAQPDAHPRKRSGDRPEKVKVASPRRSRGAMSVRLVKPLVGLSLIAVVLLRPPWFTDALDKGATKFVGIFATTPADIEVVEPEKKQPKQKKSPRPKKNPEKQQEK